LLVLVVDQPNIPFTAVRPLQDTLNAFVDRLTASDSIAVIGFGQRAPSLVFTNDRDRVKRALSQMAGQESPDGGRHSIGLATALALDRQVGSCYPQCSSPT